jgi:hypothetical protein
VEGPRRCFNTGGGRLGSPGRSLGGILGGTADTLAKSSRVIS